MRIQRVIVRFLLWRGPLVGRSRIGYLKPWAFYTLAVGLACMSLAPWPGVAFALFREGGGEGEWAAFWSGLSGLLLLVGGPCVIIGWIGRWEFLGDREREWRSK